MPQVSASRVGGVRSDNLALILTTVHREGALTRAELTRRTGLNRSTVAALVAELTDLGYLAESGLDRSPESPTLGRPSPLVSATHRHVVVTVNPEVDATEIAVVSLGAAVLSRTRTRAPQPSPERVVALVSDALATLHRESPEHQVVAIVIAVPGLITSDGVVRWAPHLGWRSVALADAVRAATGVPAIVANDARVGGIAERAFGSARGVDLIVSLNGGSSGIGGSVLVAGRALEGRDGFAGEFGHIRFGDPREWVTDSGVWEDEVNRSRLERALRREGLDDTGLHAAVLGATDAAFLGELSRQRRLLARGIADVATMLDPDLVVLGGFLASLWESDPSGFADEVRSHRFAESRDGVKVCAAALGADRLHVGAAEVGFAAILADPRRVAIASKFWA